MLMPSVRRNAPVSHVDALNGQIDTVLGNPSGFVRVVARHVGEPLPGSRVHGGAGQKQAAMGLAAIVSWTRHAPMKRRKLYKVPSEFG